MAAPKTIYFTRHAQAYHNVAEDYTIPDAALTPLGKEQSRKLNETTKDTFQQTAELLVSSPLRRPMQTMLIGYPVLKKRLGDKVTLLTELQEVNDHPCDTGSSREDLEANPEFAGLDFSPLSDAPATHGVAWTSKKGIYDPKNVLERAKWVRKWLRNREETVIVVVAHGDILRAITDGYQSATPWANAEVRAYRFASPDDNDAEVVPIKEVTKEGGDDPTSSEMK